MPSRARWPLVILALLFAFPSWPRAWTDPTRLRMVRDALKVTPPALNAILGRYRDDLDRGMTEPSRHENEEVHFQNADGSGGLAAAAIEHEAKEIRTLLESRGSLRRFAYEMGVLAHLMTDVAFPLNASDADPREPLYRESYRRFIEQSLNKIPFVLEPGTPEELKRGDLRGFVMRCARRAARGYALIGPAFKDDGTPRSPAALDERSVPFGIASLSYSRATSDIVRLWSYVWASMNGDFTGTPHLEAADGDAPAREPSP